MLLSAAIRPRETSPSRSFSAEDPSIVASAREGDSQAFGILASIYRKRILNTVRRITGNLADAEDVTQQALMNAFVNIRNFRGTCAFSSWLTRIAINEALMWKRRLKVRSEVGLPNSSAPEEPVIVPEIADIRPNPEQCYDKQEQGQLAVAALQKLKPASRLPLEICDLSERSLKDLAMLQGISLCAAKSRLFRSRNLLRAKALHFLRARTGTPVRPTNLPA